RRRLPVGLRRRAGGSGVGAARRGLGRFGLRPLYAVSAFGRTGTFCTLPAFRHEVQTRMRLGDPFTRARTRWMLGFQRRFVRRWEWLIAIPKDGCLPHTSQTAGMSRG